jgi:type II secretory pathway component PulJ
MPSIPSGSDCRQTQKKTAEGGFSLVEVLAALVVTLLLVVALTPFVRHVLATWARGTETARFVELVTRGVAALRQDLRHAIVWTGFGERENLLLFGGNEASMSLPVATGLGPGRDGLEMISVTVDTSRDGRALVRRRALLVGSTYVSFRDPVVPLSGPFRYVFRYFPREAAWMPVWNNAHELPARVELTIIGEKGPIFSAPLELPLLASMSAGCLTSSNLPGCPNAAPEKNEEEEWMREHGLLGDGK